MSAVMWEVNMYTLWFFNACESNKQFCCYKFQSLKVFSSCYKDVQLRKYTGKPLGEMKAVICTVGRLKVPGTLPDGQEGEWEGEEC